MQAEGARDLAREPRRHESQVARRVATVREGWWGYYRLARERRKVFRLEGWIRRHRGKCFWLRWHGVRGRQRALRRLGVGERRLRAVSTRRGAWCTARHTLMHTGLSNAILKRYGLLVPSDLAARG